MKKIIAAFTLVTVLLSNINAQTKLMGVTLSPKIAPAKTELILNGAGVRTKYFIKVYVGGLYLKQKNKNPKQIIEADEPMAARLHIISNLMTSENMSTAIREGFEKSTKGNTTPFKKEIDLICSVFKSEPVKVGDLFEIYYTPGVGVRCFKNNVDQKVAIPGMDFKKALFGIWLSEDPVDQTLKEGMLGL